MKRSQWFVLGIGLILISTLLLGISNTRNCTKLHADHINQRMEAMRSNLGTEYMQNLVMERTPWIINCYDESFVLTLLALISFLLGVIFTIIGFLEPKTKIEENSI